MAGFSALVLPLFAVLAAASDTGCSIAANRFGAPMACECKYSESGCVGAGGTWTKSPDCSCADPDPNDTPTSGCYIKGGACDCSVSEQGCTFPGGEWKNAGCDTCVDDAPRPVRSLSTAEASPSPSPEDPEPPAPPSPPPPDCLPQPGSGLAKNTADTPDPINEPCYSHQSCRIYGDPASDGFTCCVAVGTCDATDHAGRVYKSNTRDYYEGGCVGTTYRKWRTGNPNDPVDPNDTSDLASTSTSTTFPSTTEGCAKQGECHMPYMEHYKTWSATGGPMAAAALPEATMDRLLVGATEAYTGACKDSYFAPTTTDHAMTMQFTASGDVSAFTAAVLTGIKQNIAIAMKVHVDAVIVTIAGGSVVIDASIVYSSSAARDAGISTSSGLLTSTTAASSLLSTSTFTVTVTTIDNAGAVALAGPTQNQAKEDKDGMETWAVVVIIAGAAAVLIVGAIAFMMMKKKKFPVKNVGAA